MTLLTLHQKRKRTPLALISLFIIFQLSVQFALSVDTLRLVACNSSSVNGTDLCSGCNLTEALRGIANGSYNGSGDCLAIYLPAGLHEVEERVVVNDISVELYGEKGSVVTCSNISEQGDLDKPGFFPYIALFSNAEKFRIQNLTFDGCLYPISVEYVSEVTILNSVFKNFKEAVLDLFNNEMVELQNNDFSDNTGSSRSNAFYRGNTGAVSIGYYELNKTKLNPTVLMQDCEFRNNSVSVFQSEASTSNAVVGSNIYKGRGGALGIFLGDVFHNITVQIRGCKFTDNKSVGSSGGCYVAYDGTDVYHNVTVMDSTFENGQAGKRGGGILFAFISTGNQNYPMLATVFGCNFTNNTASSGSAISVTPIIITDTAGMLVTLKSCRFHRNKAEGFGGAVRFIVFDFFSERILLHKHIIEDCVFTENEAQRGILGIAYLPVKFSGTVRFESNIGQAIRVVGAVLTISGKIELTNNTATSGGAIYLLSFGQLILNNGSEIILYNNTGRVGAGIVVENQRSSVTYTNLLFNPQCFLIYFNPQAAPVDWNEAQIKFIGNNAVVGADVLSRSLDTCSWFSFQSPYFGVRNFSDWSLFNMSGNTSMQLQTGPVEVTVTQENISVYPGESISLEITLLDQLDIPTVGTVEFLYQPNDMSDEYTLDIEPSVFLAQPNTLANLTFLIPGSQNSEINTNGTIRVVDLDRSGIVPELVNISLRACPPGQVLVKVDDVTPQQCQCNFADQAFIVLCSGNDFVVLNIPYWAIYAEGRLNAYISPPGFYKCNSMTSFTNNDCFPVYNISNPTDQCVCSREGVLCGSCKEGLSVTALYSHCVTCHNAVGVVFAILVIFQVVVCLLITLSNFRMRSWMFSILFYLRMMSFVSVHLFPTFEAVGRYLYFLSSLSSLYLPYDFCIPNTGALGAFALKYLPLFTGMIVCPLTFTFVFLYIKCKKPEITRFKKYQWDGVTTLIFLILSHTLYNSFSILNCPMIYDYSEELHSRWHYNGDQRCFSGGHIPLALWSILVLAAIITLTVFLAIVTVKFKLNETDNKLAVWLSIQRSLKAPFKKEREREEEEEETKKEKETLSWWMIVELLRRIVFILVITIFPYSTIAPLLVLVLLIAIYGYFKPFESSFSNYLDIFLMGCMVVIISIAGTSFITQSTFSFTSVPLAVEDCANEFPGVALFSWISLPFYYLPLVVSICAVVVYYISLYRDHFQTKKSVDLQRGAENDDGSRNLGNVGFSSIAAADEQNH